MFRCIECERVVEMDVGKWKGGSDAYIHIHLSLSIR